jgi:hypothetical protein
MSGQMIRDSLHLNGAWVAPAGRGLIEVTDPATEEVIGSAPEGPPQEGLLTGGTEAPASCGRGTSCGRRRRSRSPGGSRAGRCA